jgi:outer membrane protein assembly factor BamE
MSVLFTPEQPVVLIWPARLSLVALACAGLGACGSFDGATTRVVSMVTPYKVEIVQGNFVSKEQVQALQAGMSRSQVRDILGSPLITSAFHTDRWDYVFTIRRQGTESQSRRVIVRFTGDQLLSMDTGGPLPSEREFVASIDTFKTARNAPPLELSPEEVKALPVPPKPATAPTEPIGPTRAYPPLEPPQ